MASMDCRTSGRITNPSREFHPPPSPKRPNKPLEASFSIVTGVFKSDRMNGAKITAKSTSRTNTRLTHTPPRPEACCADSSAAFCFDNCISRRRVCDSAWEASIFITKPLKPPPSIAISSMLIIRMRSRQRCASRFVHGMLGRSYTLGLA